MLDRTVMANSAHMMPTAHQAPVLMEHVPPVQLELLDKTVTATLATQLQIVLQTPVLITTAHSVD